MTRVAVVTLGALLIAGCTDVLQPVHEERERPVPLFANGTSDVTPPELTALSFSPSTINTTTAPASVTVSYSVTDDLSGEQVFFARFRSPSGSQEQTNNDFYDPSTNRSGAIQIYFPQFSEPGVWTLDGVFVRDAVGNTRNYTAADLATLGFPTTLVVQNTIRVVIDIKPGSNPNSINPTSKGTTPVAILSSADFDAPAQVDRTSLTFGRTGDEASLAFCNASSEDVNADGRLDLVCHFTIQQTGFLSGDTEGILKGRTVSGTPIEGRDAVRVIR